MVENSPAGFTVLRDWLASHGVSPVHACLEATGTYWEAVAEYLTDVRHTVSVVNIARFGSLGQVPEPFLLRSDNGQVFTSRHYTRLARSYGLKQEFITPHCPHQNGMVERVIRSLKEQCIHRSRFESLSYASHVISDWIRFYNHRRPHQALHMKTPAMAFALAA